MANRYRMLHNHWDANLAFAFPVERARQATIYIDPMWGVQIVSVTADGASVPGQPHTARFDDVNFNQVAIGDEPFIYLVRRSNLVFARTLQGMDFTLEKYVIPERAERIVFEYRLRESGGGFGPVLRLESTVR